MSKKVDICDACGTRWPQYHFRVKWWWFQRSTGKRDICESCWVKVLRLTREKKAE